MIVRFRDGHPDDGSAIPDGEYMDIHEMSVRYDLPVETVRTWAKRGQLPCVSYYGRIFIPCKCDFVSLKKVLKRL